MDKFLFLLSAKLEGKYRIYPDYIDLEDDITIIENKKRNFRSSIINYILNSEYQLCFLHIKKEQKINLNNRRSNNRHKKKLLEEVDLYTIPTVNNVIELLEKYIFQLCIRVFKNEGLLEEYKIFYNGINYDINEIQNLCAICAKIN